MTPMPQRALRTDRPAAARCRRDRAPPAAPARARSTIGAPAAVTRTPRAPRSNICTPIACSSCATCALIDGCATPQASAALRKPPRSATATRYCSCRSEYGMVSQRAIATDYQFQRNDIFEPRDAGPYTARSGERMSTEAKCPFNHAGGGGAPIATGGRTSCASICCTSIPRSPIRWTRTSTTRKRSTAST